MRRVTRMVTMLALCAALLLGPAGGAGAAEKLVLDRNSDGALLVIKTPWWQPAPSMHSAYRLTLSRYDPVAERLLGKPFGGSVIFAAQKKKFLDEYLVVRAKPGRWVFQSYSQQDKWALCFNAHSWQFDVKPGQVVYLGEFDALRLREQLTRHAILSGKSMIFGYGFADFFDLSESPRTRPIDEAQIAALAQTLGRLAPQVTAPIVAAEYSPAKFGTGSTLFAERRCGGYFLTGANKGQGKSERE